jgi:porphobilinogen deaminase
LAGTEVTVGENESWHSLVTPNIDADPRRGEVGSRLEKLDCRERGGCVP